MLQCPTPLLSDAAPIRERMNAKAQPAMALLEQSFEPLMQHALILCEQLQSDAALHKLCTHHAQQLQLASHIVRYAARPPHSTPQPMGLEAFIWEWATSTQGLVKPAKKTKHATNVWIDSALILPLLDGFIQARQPCAKTPLHYAISSDAAIRLTNQQDLGHMKWRTPAELAAALAPPEGSAFTTTDALLLGYALLIEACQPVSFATDPRDQLCSIKLNFTEL